MGSQALCFSSASILRCESFTSLQSQLLIIPTALELIFSTSLIITNWGTGWRHLLLTAEGWSYFALALLELLSHIIPAVRDDVSVFTIVDIVLGATSFLPIFFYTLFVYLFTRGELIDTLPKRFQRIANILLLFFIPAIIALNELSSFVGISRRTIIVNAHPVVEVGFRNFSDQQLWTFLSSLNLAFLTAFEAINFCFAFYRLIRAFVDQRRIEVTSTEQAHFIRGIGWISAGFKLGAIETVIGFAQGGFGGALVRRSLRFLARAFLIIGIVKGVDQVDDFTNLEKEMGGGRARTGTQRRSRLAMLISNPRFSTFRQLSPTAGEFYAEKGKGREIEPSSYPAPPQATYAAPAMAEFTQLKRQMTSASAAPSTFSSYPNRPNQRVTVHLQPAGPPTLHMRFSGLEMPSPALIAESVKARPVSASWVSVARSSRYAPSTYTATSPNFMFDPLPPVPVPTAYPEYIHEKPQAAHARGLSEFSARSSAYPDSLNGAVLGALAAQFPGPPPVSTTRPPMPSPIPESTNGSGWGADLEAYPRERREQQDEYHSVFDNDRDSVYGASVRTPPRPAQQQLQRPRIVTVPDPDSPEPVYKYSYDGPVSGGGAGRVEHPYVYAYSPAVGNDDYSPPANIDAFTSPEYNNNANAYAGYNTNNERPVFSNPFATTAAAVPNNAYSAYNAYAAANTYPNPYDQPSAGRQQRTGRSDTTMGTTPMTYQSSSRFDDHTESSSTPNTDTEGTDPFRFDGPGMSSTKAGARYAEAPVYMEDGPRRDEGAGHLRSRSDMTLGVGQRTSAALLQMTQRGDADWAPAGVEFTPSVFAPSTPTSSRQGYNTLKKKRRPSMKSGKSVDVPSSVADTLASSSWLHPDAEDEDDVFADDERQRRQQQQYAESAAHRVKSVGRVRAPRKATPAPVASRHGLTRGSVYIQPITVPPVAFSSEVQIVQGGSSADSYSSEFKDRP
ncbi:hypothetical protein B0H19DRAFT_1260013 [Mycena capillaripes]|nr:hypothetical protein B0H19DRAFT_1260013 [Mycena capillaripes]